MAAPRLDSTRLTSVRLGSARLFTGHRLGRRLSLSILTLSSDLFTVLCVFGLSFWGFTNFSFVISLVLFGLVLFVGSLHDDEIIVCLSMEF